MLHLHPRNLTMGQCMWCHVLHLPASVFCECVPTGFGTGFSRWGVLRYTSLWGRAHQDACPDHQPKAELQLDPLRFATSLRKHDVWSGGQETF